MSKNVLVLVFHPDLKGASRINRALAHEAAGAPGVTVRDEYALYPDLRIDAAAEQDALIRADRVVWQFPVYWYSSPALLKQWEDEVLALGWAYGEGGGRLEGKELMCAVTAGSTSDRYTAEGDHGHTMGEVLVPMEITAKYVGMPWIKPFAVYDTFNLTDEQVARAARDYAQAITA